jgi:hypothetical protein
MRKQSKGNRNDLKDSEILETTFYQTSGKNGKLLPHSNEKIF